MTQGRMRQVYPISGEVFGYQVAEGEGVSTFILDGEAIGLVINSPTPGEGWCRTPDGRSHAFFWVWVGTELHLWLDGDLLVFQRANSRRRGGAEAADAAEDILAPMPGVVLEVLVSQGTQVERNQTVMVMESMKMELVITAPRSGVVRRVSVEVGDQVDRGMRLLELGSEANTDG